MLIFRRTVAPGMRSPIGPGRFLTAVVCLCAALSLHSSPESEVDLTPWKSGERMVFESMNRDETQLLGYLALSIQSSSLDDRPTWRIESRDSRESTGYSLVEVDADSFLPIYSVFRSEGMGEIEARYQDEGVAISHRLRQAGSRLKQLNRTYEIFQSSYLMRKFPVQNGYQQPVYMVDSSRPAKQIPAIMRITEIKNISTIHGDQLCYRVTALIGETRVHFWIGINEHRWIYRIENEGVGVMRLVDAFADAAEHPDQFEAGQPGSVFRLTLPPDWLAFSTPDTTGIINGDQVTFLPPGGLGSLKLSRHPKMVSLDQVYDGSINWLKENRRKFALNPSSITEIHTGKIKGRSFTGSYEEDRNQMTLFHALVEEREHLYIFTAHAPSGYFSDMEKSLGVIVQSLESFER